MTRVTLICGGLGGARLAPWLAERCELTVVANVADDDEFYGLRVCPDIDAVLYALAGEFDHERGWGVTGETWRLRDELRATGIESWFAIGDRDLRTHVARTTLLRSGEPLSRATAMLSAARRITARVLPATDHPLRTVIDIGGEEISFQSFFVEHRGALAPVSLRLAGLADALPAPGVIDAIERAEVIITADSSPIASIGPTLALPGVRAAIVSASAIRIAIAPMVLSVPAESTADRHHCIARAAFMRAAGLAHCPVEVARLYADLIDCFVLHTGDLELAPAVAAASRARVLGADLLARDRAGRRALVELLLGAAGADA